MFREPLGERQYLIAEDCHTADNVAANEWGWRRVSPGRYVRPGDAFNPATAVFYIDREHSMNGLSGKTLHVGRFRSPERRSRMLDYARSLGMTFEESWPNASERQLMREISARWGSRRPEVEPGAAQDTAQDYL